MTEASSIDLIWAEPNEEPFINYAVKCQIISEQYRKRGAAEKGISHFVDQPGLATQLTDAVLEWEA
jgi:hypothetical protein